MEDGLVGDAELQFDILDELLRLAQGREQALSGEVEAVVDADKRVHLLMQEEMRLEALPAGWLDLEEDIRLDGIAELGEIHERREALDERALVRPQAIEDRAHGNPRLAAHRREVHAGVVADVGQNTIIGGFHCYHRTLGVTLRYMRTR